MDEIAIFSDIVSREISENNEKEHAEIRKLLNEDNVEIDEEVKINWKAIRHITWDDIFYQQAFDYLKSNGKDIPKHFNANKKSKFRKQMKPFSIENNEIVLITNQKPPWFELMDIVILPIKLTVISDAQKNDYLKEFWKDPKANAFSNVQKMYERLIRQTIGITRKDVKQFISQIEVVQLLKPAGRPVLQPIVKDHPMQMWQADLTNVSQYQSTNNHIHYLLVVIDVFSKFCWIRALRNKEAPLVALEMQNIILQESAPQIIHTDNGSEFRSNEWKELLNRFSIRDNHSLAYSPWIQGLVERTNRSIKDRIARHLSQNNTTRYIDRLAWINFSYNTTVHSSTKKTPMEVHRGFVRQSSMLNDYVKANIEKSADKMINQSLKRINFEKSLLNVGDMVRVSDLATAKGRKRFKELKTHKLSPEWSKETYQVVARREFRKGQHKYQLNASPEPKRSEFHRYELQKVEPERTMQSEDRREQEDLHFGVKTGIHFDVQEHLSKLGANRSAQALLRRSQSEIETDQLKEEAQKLGVKLRDLPSRRARLQQTIEEIRKDQHKEERREVDEMIGIVPDSEGEKKPQRSAQKKKKDDTFEVKAIVGKKTEKIRGQRRVFYKVRWDGYSESDDTFEPRSKLMRIKGIAQLIRDYENN